MSTDTRTSRAVWVFGVAAAAVVLTLGIVLLARAGQTSMAKGMAVGGLVTLFAVFVARYRAGRRPDRASSLTRSAANLPDERDAAVLAKALAWTGYAALLLSCAGSVAAALGADATVLLSALPLVLVVVLGTGFAVAQRRL